MAKKESLFSSGFFGYNKKQVDRYIEDLQLQYEEEIEEISENLTKANNEKAEALQAVEELRQAMAQQERAMPTPQQIQSQVPEQLPQHQNVHPMTEQFPQQQTAPVAEHFQQPQQEALPSQIGIQPKPEQQYGAYVATAAMGYNPMPKEPAGFQPITQNQFQPQPQPQQPQPQPQQPMPQFKPQPINPISEQHIGNSYGMPNAPQGFSPIQPTSNPTMQPVNPVQPLSNPSSSAMQPMGQFNGFSSGGLSPQPSFNQPTTETFSPIPTPTNQPIIPPNPQDMGGIGQPPIAPGYNPYNPQQ